MYHYFPDECLPSAAELPDSDDTPVDNELQNLIPNLLASILAMAWSERTDWFFGVDMGIYYAPSQPPIVPDGFLSLGVDRFVDEEGRLSYVLWEEDNIPPILALEVVSKTYGGEYEQKKQLYAELGVLYYVIYVPSRRYRRKGRPLEVYKLIDGAYVLQSSDSSEAGIDLHRVWLPEVGFAIGREAGTHQGRTREWLYWYSQDGQRLLTPEEAAVQAQQQVDRLAAKLRELGIDPDRV